MWAAFPPLPLVYTPLWWLCSPNNIWSYRRCLNSPCSGGSRAFWSSQISASDQSVLVFPISKQGTRQKHLLQGRKLTLKSRDQRMVLNNFLACSKIYLSLACQSHSWYKEGQGTKLRPPGTGCPSLLLDHLSSSLLSFS